jgi:hypothetical protein
LTVSDGRTGMLAREFDEFRSHLAELLADRTRREAMGTAAREYVAAHHSIDVRARQVEELLSADPSTARERSK